MSEDNQKKRQELYAETRRDLLTRQLSNSERYDGAILTLSTAALGVSLAFIKDIVPVSVAQCLGLLKASWWFLGLAIISTLASFVVSQRGISRQLYYAEQYYLYGKGEYLTKPNSLAKATDIMNYVSGCLFVVALMFTIMFVSTNLGGGPSMTEDKNSKVALNEAAPISNKQPTSGGGTEEKGAPIPNMQPVSGGQSQSGGGSGSGGQSSSTNSGQGKQK